MFDQAERVQKVAGLRSMLRACAWPRAQMMEPFGNVLHAVVLLDMSTGQSRGFGFVHMDNPDSANAAVTSMAGKARAPLPPRLPLPSSLSAVHLQQQA